MGNNGHIYQHEDANCDRCGLPWSDNSICAGEQGNIKDKRIANLLPHQFKKGQSGNPSGRPAGKSLKERAKLMLQAMTPEEEQEYLQGIDKRIIWEMAEGKAKQDVDISGEITSKIIKLDE